MLMMCHRLEIWICYQHTILVPDYTQPQTLKLSALLVTYAYIKTLQMKQVLQSRATENDKHVAKKIHTVHKDT